MLIVGINQIIRIEILKKKNEKISRHFNRSHINRIFLSLGTEYDEKG